MTILKLPDSADFKVWAFVIKTRTPARRHGYGTHWLTDANTLRLTDAENTALSLMHLINNSHGKETHCVQGGSLNRHVNIFSGFFRNFFFFFFKALKWYTPFHLFTVSYKLLLYYKWIHLFPDFLQKAEKEIYSFIVQFKSMKIRNSR